MITKNLSLGWCIISVLLLAGCSESSEPPRQTSGDSAVKSDKPEPKQDVSVIHAEKIDMDAEFSVFQRHASWEEIFAANDGFYALWDIVGYVGPEKKLNLSENATETRIDCMGSDPTKIAALLKVMEELKPTAVFLPGNITQKQLNQLCAENPQLTSAWIATDAEDLSCLNNLIKLRELYLDRSKVKRHDFLRSMPHLRVFEDKGAQDLEEVTPISECINLEVLRLGVAKPIASIEELQKLTNLKRLTLHGSAFTTTKNADFISHLNQLRSISLEGFDLRSLPDFSACDELTDLRLTGCNQLQINEPVSLPELVRLELLNIHLISLESFSLSPRLQYLELQRTGIKNYEFLKQFPQLTELWLTGEPSFESLDPLQPLSNLKTLRVENCKHFKSLRGLSELESLEKASFFENEALEQNSFDRQAADKRGISISIF